MKTIENRWERPMELPLGDGRPPGVDWVYTSCNDEKKGNGESSHTNLRVLAHAVPSLPTVPSGAPSAPSVLVLLIDSLSRRRFELDMPETHALLRSMPTAHAFPHSSVFGQNTDPNVAELLESSRETVFHAAQRNEVVSSVWDDYCPEHGACEFYPFKHHKVCTNLLCNYGKDIRELYHDVPSPGCRHGEWWYNQQLRYIDSLWKAYPGKRKFHFGTHNGCHMGRSNSEVCNSNDAVLAAFLRDFVPANPDTIIVLTSDHGFHWMKVEEFNEQIAGELEHRTPLLEILTPEAFDTTVLKGNTGRFVSHRDVHATLLGMLGGWRTPSDAHASGGLGIDLMKAEVPERRSCHDAGIPRAWCNCFRRATPADDCWLDSKIGEVCNRAPDINGTQKEGALTR